MAKGRKHAKRGGRTRRLRGGMISSPAAYPQGEAWGPPVRMWPGVQGDASQFGNHYSYNTNVEPWPESTSNTSCGPCAVGGKRTKRRGKGKSKGTKRKTRRTRRAARRAKGRMSRRSRSRGGKGKRQTRARRGGSRDTIIPQELVNGYRSVGHSLQQFAADWQGVSGPASPLPADQTLQGSDNLPYSPIDVPQITANADRAVSQL